MTTLSIPRAVYDTVIAHTLAEVPSGTNHETVGLRFERDIHGVLREGVNFLQKPFSPKALSFKVHEVLYEEL